MTCQVGRRSGVCHPGKERNCRGVRRWSVDGWARAVCCPIPPKLRHVIRRFPFKCVECAQIGPGKRPSKQKRPRRAAWKFLIFLRKSGAGEGIRTLDPNLGKFETPSIRQHLVLSQSPLSPYYKTSFLADVHPASILLTPFESRFRASPLLPRPPPGFPGKQNPEFTMQIRGI